jgi:hypothetical protein
MYKRKRGPLASKQCNILSDIDDEASLLLLLAKMAIAS